MTDSNTTDLATELAAGLRDLADFIDANPDLAEMFRSSLMSSGIKVHPSLFDTADGLARFARAAARHGARVEKEIDDIWHNVIAHLGGIKVEALAYRSEVCERVVTGVETVTRTVPDPDALAAVPTVEVTEEVEQVEWVCRPLLDTAPTETAEAVSP